MNLIVLSLAVIFAVVSAKPNGYLVPKRVEHLDDGWNTYIDNIVAGVVKHMTHNVTLPDSEITLNPSGKTSITNGFLAGFPTLQRSGNVNVTSYIGEKEFLIPCSFKELKYTGHYRSSLGTKSSRGSFTGTISRSTFSILVFYVEDTNKITTMLSYKDSGNVTITLNTTNTEPEFKAIILSQLKEYSVYATDKTMEIFFEEIQYAAEKVQEEIDNRRRSTTVKY